MVFWENADTLNDAFLENFGGNLDGQLDGGVCYDGYGVFCLLSRAAVFPLEFYLTEERVSVGQVNEEIRVTDLLHDQVAEPGGNQLEVTQDFYHVLY